MTTPVGIAWQGADEAELFEGGFGPLVLGDYPNALTTPEESLCGMFGDPDALPALIHAARGDDDSLDIFGDAGSSLWERLTSRWGRFKDWLNGPVPGDDGATISANYYPWGML